MNKYSINLIVVLLVICIFTFSKKFSPEEANTTINPANENATSATKELLQLLHRIQNQHTIIGHQDDLAYGNGWRYNVYNPKGYISDTYNAGGDFPGVFGWDIGQLENTLTDPKVNYVINGVLINDLKYWIKKVHLSGGINYVSWHANNPETGKDSWDYGD